MPHTVVTAIRTYDHVAAECHANASTTPFIQTRIDQLCVLCQSNSLILDLNCGPGFDSATIRQQRHRAVDVICSSTSMPHLPPSDFSLALDEYFRVLASKKARASHGRMGVLPSMYRASPSIGPTRPLTEADRSRFYFA